MRNYELITPDTKQEYDPKLRTKTKIVVSPSGMSKEKEIGKGSIVSLSKYPGQIDESSNMEIKNFGAINEVFYVSLLSKSDDGFYSVKLRWDELAEQIAYGDSSIVEA